MALVKGERLQATLLDHVAIQTLLLLDVGSPSQWDIGIRLTWIQSNLSQLVGESCTFERSPDENGRVGCRSGSGNAARSKTRIHSKRHRFNWGSRLLLWVPSWGSNHLYVFRAVPHF